MVDVASLYIRADSSEVRSADKDIGGLNKTAGLATKAIFGLGGAFAVFDTARKSIDAFSRFDKALIGVGKTTGLTGSELEALGRQIQIISRTVPVASDQLLALAQSAGQLGVSGSENIAKFTRVVAELGLASDLAGEEAASSLARILTVTGTAISDVDRLGSTIVALGNNFAATESEIAGMLTRVSQGVALFNVTAAEAAGISVALKAVGVEAENGGTQVGFAFQAINEAVRRGGDKMRTLQMVTGQTAKQLQAAFLGGDAASVFQSFIEGLGQISRSGGDVGAVLEDMGLSGTRAVAALGTLAQRSDVLGRALEMANSEWDRNLALTEEAAVAATSFSSQVAIMVNALDEVLVILGREMAPAILQVINGFRSWLLEAGNTQAIIEIAQGIGKSMMLVVDILGVLIDLAKVAALVFGARLVASLVATSASFVAANLKAISYQFNLKRVAGIAPVAASGLLAVGAAGRAAATGLALIGGPVGAIALAVGALYAFWNETFKVGEVTIRVGGFVKAIWESIKFAIVNVIDDLKFVYNLIGKIKSGDFGSIGGLVQDRVDAQAQSAIQLEQAWVDAFREIERPVEPQIDSVQLEGLKDLLKDIESENQNFELPDLTKTDKSAERLSEELVRLRDQLNFVQGEFTEAEAKAIQFARANDLISKTDPISDKTLDNIQELIDAYDRLSDAEKQLAENREELRKMEQQAQEVADVFGRSFEDAFMSMIDGTKKASDAFKDMADAIINDIARIIMKRSITEPLGNAIGDIVGDIDFGSIFGGTNAPISGGTGTSSVNFGAPGFRNAKGNAFSNGNVVPFAKGGVVNSPTYFPFSKGTGLMGEAGPEAIIPLKRGPDGKLGVSGGGGSTQVTVNIRNENGGQVEASQNGDTLDIVIKRVAQDIANGGRTFGAISKTFSIQPVATRGT